MNTFWGNQTVWPDLLKDARSIPGSRRVPVDPVESADYHASGHYRGDKEVREIDDPVFQGVDWLSVRPKIKTAPRIIRPGPVD